MDMRGHLRWVGPIASLVAVSTAHAADPALEKVLPAPIAETSIPIDFAFGARVQSDYNFRGISQSDRDPSVSGYIEAQFFDDLLYAGVAAYRVDLPTSPDAEVDITFGIRPKLGPLAFDIGVIRYWYPGERRLFDAAGNYLTVGNTDFVELAGRVSYTYEDRVTLGANVYYSWDWLGSGADGTYASLTAKVNLPFVAGLALSGEFGHYWLGTTSPQAFAFNVPDYLYWNAGVSYTWKNLTVDLRYHDTDLSKGDCFLVGGDPSGALSGNGRSSWCDAALVATLSVDFTASQLGIFAPR